VISSQVFIIVVVVVVEFVEIDP